MAMGFSGSNGGINGECRSVVHGLLPRDSYGMAACPREVSYFVNNVCNLRCKHCYVGYADTDGSIEAREWQDIFAELIEQGSRTFGNVGKEPLLDWPKTSSLLAYLRDQRDSVPDLRFGLVTNGTLLDDARVAELAAIGPNYVDVSLDGDEPANDHIRGQGSYARTMAGLARAVRTPLADKIFISFTLNSANRSSVGALAREIHRVGIRNLLISPYVSLMSEDPLRMSVEAMVQWVTDLLEGRIIEFAQSPGMSIYFKNDFGTTRPLMAALVDRGIIDVDALFVDESDVVFCKHERADSNVLFNYQVRDDFPTRAIRISHDGYVSTCLDMFYEEYPSRAIGNVRDTSITSILEGCTAMSGPNAGEQRSLAVLTGAGVG